MLAEAEASSLDEQFATIVIREDEMKEYLKQHHDFRLLDQVFIDFLSSNRHRRRNWTFEQLLSVKSPSPGKEFVYDSSGVPYRGAVWLYEGSDNDQVSLKLHNDGFAYTSKPGRRVTRHISNKGQQHGWVPMPWGEIQPFIPEILACTKPLYSEVKVWYNSSLNKLDLEFIKPKDASMPDLLLGFEPGRPAYDSQIKAHCI
ncbi:TPA: hypothetical protein ACH3X1_005315 [Trebouxia sp. C0004]